MSPELELENARGYAPSPIGVDSWLNGDEYANFRWAYGYACSQSCAIPALARISAEDAYLLHSMLSRGEAHRARLNAEESITNNPEVARPTSEKSLEDPEVQALLAELGEVVARSEFRVVEDVELDEAGNEWLTGSSPALYFKGACKLLKSRHARGRTKSRLQINSGQGWEDCPLQK